VFWNDFFKSIWLSITIRSLVHWDKLNDNYSYTWFYNSNIATLNVSELVIRRRPLLLCCSIIKEKWINQSIYLFPKKVFHEMLGLLVLNRVFFGMSTHFFKIFCSVIISRRLHEVLHLILYNHMLVNSILKKLYLIQCKENRTYKIINKWSKWIRYNLI